MGSLTFYKATAPGGVSFYDQTTRYIVGQTISVANPAPPSVGSCGRGLHVVRRLCSLKKYVSNEKLKCAEFYEVEVESTDVIANDSTKTRVRALRVIRRIEERDVGILRGRLGDILGYGFGYGDGSGDGSGDGYGYGSGYGSGYGYGYGYGDGSGYGDGDSDCGI